MGKESPPNIVMKTKKLFYYIIMIFSIILIISFINLVNAQYIDSKIIKMQNASVTMIIRDRYGVPHIFSNTLEGLFYGYGYALAQDRLYQLEILRRIATGTVSELLGSKFIELDKVTRREGITLDEIKMRINMLKPEYMIILESFAKGINAYIDDALKDPDKLLPREFHKLKIQPKYFTSEEIAAIFIRIIGMVFSDSTREMINMQLLQYLINRYGENVGRAIFNDLVWREDPGAPPSIMKGSSLNIDNKIISLPFINYYSNIKDFQKNYIELFSTNLSTISELKEAERALEEMMELGVPVSMGSNAIVIGPNRSETGCALLMGGPQFTWTAPSFLYEVGLHGAGFNVVGSTIVGFPVILFGHNDRIAWTATAGNGNLVDIFMERLNPNNTNQYWYKGKWVNMSKRVEIIKVAGGDPVSLEVFRTVHGPVVAIDVRNGVAFAKKRAWEGLELESLAAWIDATRARTLKEWLDAASRFAFSIDWFYADVEGNIAYVFAGKYPVRDPRIDPRLPTPGTGEFEWRGLLPFEKQPWVVNPPSGFIVGWNNKPVDGWDNGDLGPLWGSADRTNILIKLVKEQRKISMDKLKEIVKISAITDVNFEYFKNYIINAAKSRPSLDPLLMAAVKEIEAWNGLYLDDGSGYYNSIAPTIFQEWLSTMLNITFADELGPYFTIVSYTPPRGYWPFSTNVPIGARVLLHVLQGNKSSIPPSFDYFNGKNMEDIIIESLKITINKLIKRYNTSDINKWKLPILKARFELGSQFLGLVPYGNITLPDMPYMNRGTENHLVELCYPVKGENVVPPGNSGFVSKDGTPSPHFSDQVALYVNWKYKPMLLNIDEILGNMESFQIINLPNIINKSIDKLSKGIEDMREIITVLDKKVTILENNIKYISNESSKISDNIRLIESNVNSRIGMLQMILYILMIFIVVNIIIYIILLRKR